jgi:arylsulfatase A-like enzyme
VVLPSIVAAIAALPWLIRWAAARWLSKAAGEQKGEPRGKNARMWPVAVTGVALLAASALPAYSSRAGVGARAPTTTMILTTADALQTSLITPVDATATALNTSLKPIEAAASSRRNLVFLILESTRASAVSIYNESLNTTPFLKELATRSTVAESAYVVVPHSSKALVAILCGIAPNLRMAITESIANNIPGNCLAELLGEQGYRTTFFQSAPGTFEDRRQLVENFGFQQFTPGNEMDHTGLSRANYFGYEDDIMLKPSREWLEENGEKPFFAAYFTVTPHHQYLAPKRYGRHDYVKKGKFNRYLNAVHYLDNFVKNIIEQYKELGLYEETIFVVVGDHGEGFGEHGRYQHDNVIYEEGIRVPMLILDPQNPQPRRAEYNVNHLDLLPTVLKRLGFEVVGGTYPGTPLLEVEAERPMRANCWYERRCMTRIVGDEKYIYHFGKRSDEFFNLAEDPDETKNLASTLQDLNKWRHDLIEWRRRVIGVHKTHGKQALDEVIFEEMPPVEHLVDARFGEEVRLVGYDISVKSAHPGEPLTITWYFESLAEIEPGWEIFVHAEGGGTMKTFDHVPVKGMLPLEDWEPGTVIMDKQTIEVPGDWTSGKIDFYLGLWHPEKGGRKKLSGNIANDGNDRALVVSIPIKVKK